MSLFWKKVFIKCSRGHLLVLCQPWKKISAIVPKTSKINRKSWSFQDFLSEMLLFKGSSGHVESMFDKAAKNLAVKLQVFLVKFQEKRKTNFSRDFLTIFALYTWLPFRHTWLFFFDKIRKNSLKVPKEMMIVLITFVIFSQSFAEDTWNALLATLPSAIYFLSKHGFFRSETENDQTNTLLSKKNIKTFRCNRRLQFWENWQKNSHQKSNTFAQRPKNLSKFYSF